MFLAKALQSIRSWRNPRLLCSLGAAELTGVAMVESQRRARWPRLYLMEVNCRFWGSLQLAIDCGVDFPRFQVSDHTRLARKGPPTLRDRGASTLAPGRSRQPHHQATAGAIDSARQGTSRGRIFAFLRGPVLSPRNHAAYLGSGPRDTGNG